MGGTESRPASGTVTTRPKQAAHVKYDGKSKELGRPCICSLGNQHVKLETARRKICESKRGNVNTNLNEQRTIMKKALDKILEMTHHKKCPHCDGRGNTKEALGIWYDEEWQPQDDEQYRCDTCNGTGLFAETPEIRRKFSDMENPYNNCKFCYDGWVLLRAGKYYPVEVLKKETNWTTEDGNGKVSKVRFLCGGNSHKLPRFEVRIPQAYITYPDKLPESADIVEYEPNECVPIDQCETRRLMTNIPPIAPFNAQNFALSVSTLAGVTIGFLLGKTLLRWFSRKRAQRTETSHDDYEYIKRMV